MIRKIFSAALSFVKVRKFRLKYKMCLRVVKVNSVTFFRRILKFNTNYLIAVLSINSKGTSIVS